MKINRIQSSIVVVLIFFLMCGLSFLIKPSNEIAAMTIFSEEDGVHRTIIFKGSIVDSNFTFGTLVHESFHQLKNNGLYKIDVPTAAAIGFYAEYTKVKSIYLKQFRSYFLNGLNSELPYRTIDELLLKYFNAPYTESINSYGESAYIAGVTAKLFEGNLDDGFGFIMSISNQVPAKIAFLLNSSDNFQSLSRQMNFNGVCSLTLKNCTECKEFVRSNKEDFVMMYSRDCNVSKVQGIKRINLLINS